MTLRAVLQWSHHITSWFYFQMPSLMLLICHFYHCVCLFPVSHWLTKKSVLALFFLFAPLENEGNKDVRPSIKSLFGDKKLHLLASDDILFICQDSWQNGVISRHSEAFSFQSHNIWVNSNQLKKIMWWSKALQQLLYGSTWARKATFKASERNRLPKNSKSFGSWWCLVWNDTRVNK